jgi:hypothetical protein
MKNPIRPKRTEMMETRSSRVRWVLAGLANPRSRQEPTGEHLRGAIQLLENLLEFGSLDRADRTDTRAAIRRLWLALGELSQGNS